MEHVGPLIQTVLWVGLIGGIVWRFRLPIHGLLVALQKRIEGGSTLKAGPFQLIDELRPQELDKQKEKVEAELIETLPSVPAPPSATRQLAQTSETAVHQAAYFQAEDLALRAIQADYGEPVRRQLTAGLDDGFDGVFSLNGRLHIVEVKYITEMLSIPRLRSRLERIARVISRYNWRNVQVILAVVFEREEDVPKADTVLLDTVKGVGVPIMIRSFSLPELQRRFGVLTR